MASQEIFSLSQHSFSRDENPDKSIVNKSKEKKHILETCARIERIYKKMNWGSSSCLDLPWNFHTMSEMGVPLLYLDLDPAPSSVGENSAKKKNTTLVLSGVHPDEFTPIYMAFELAKNLFLNENLYKNARVIIAPLVNPDGFFSTPARRTNINGVDLNRNFPTESWSRDALKYWSRFNHKDKRKFPGNYPNSEQGTRFQVDLMQRFQPDKIISIHAPLAFLDLDYENIKQNSFAKMTEEYKKAKKLREIISKSAGNYKMKDLGVYPGSLGKYAGNERNIPTITLELSSSRPKLARKFWNTFSKGLIKALQYDFFSQESKSIQFVGLENPH